MTFPSINGGLTPQVCMDPAAQARDLIKANQGEDCAVTLPGIGGVGCDPDTKGTPIGVDIASMSRTDPAQARAVLAETLKRLPDAGDRREVARGIVQSMNPDDLRTLASTPDGRTLLERARGELRANDEGRNKTLANRIDTALKSADLQKDPGFQKVDAASRQRVLNNLANLDEQPKVVDNLIALAKSPGFQAAPPTTRSALQMALAQHAKDPIFREGLAKLAGDANFQKLTPARQADAISAFDKVAKSEAYQGKDGSWFFGMGGKTVSAADKRTVLANAQQVVSSSGFHDVGAGSKQAMMNALNRHATDSGFATRLTKLSNDGGFKALNDPAKEAKLLDRYGRDSSFAQGIDTLIANPKLTGLSDANKAKVLGNMVRLAETKSYKDASTTDRQAMVEIVGGIAAYSAARPGNTTLSNTVEQVVGGNLKLGLYQRAPFTSGGQTFYNWGKANADGIFLNTDPQVRTAATAQNQYIDTLAHEVNHKLNGTTSAGTADRFLDEYRAAVVGREAALGRTLTPAEQRAAVDNLVDGTNSDYAHLANLYNTDTHFKAAVDAMYTQLNGSTDPVTGTVTAPSTISPELARAHLMAAGNSSTYLLTAGNVDNH